MESEKRDDVEMLKPAGNQLEQKLFPLIKKAREGVLGN